jgi:hypothetical protein
VYPAINFYQQHLSQYSTESTINTPHTMLPWRLQDPGTQGLLRGGYVQRNADGAVVGFGEASIVRVALLAHILCSINGHR